MNTDLIAGLRAMADFYEAHPSFPAPVMENMNAFCNTKGELADVARKFAPLKKTFKGNWFALTKNFGPLVSVDVNLEREKVCKQVVTKETVTRPRMVEDGEETVEVEKIEWECTEPLLAG